MTTLWRDLRFSFRALGRNPGFTAVAALSLALGIAANTTIFSVVSLLRFQPLPFNEPDRLVMLTESHPEQPRRWRPPNYGKIADLREHSGAFAKIGLTGGAQFVNISGDGGAERVRCEQVDINIFEVLEAKPLVGRTFAPDDVTRGGKSNAIILSYGLWQQRFAGDPNVVGQTLRMSGNQHTVIGVMPEGFWTAPWSEDSAVWQANDLSDRPNGRWMVKIARLESGIPLSQAKTDAEAVFAGWDRAQGQDENRWLAGIQPLHENYFDSFTRSTSMLLWAVGFVLLIACVNVANMMLGRGALRRKELTVRASIGAGQGALARLLLSESLALALLGGAIGVLLTFGGIRIFVLLAPDWFPLVDQIRVDLRVLGFTAALTILTGVVTGLLPALRVSRLDLQSALREGGRDSQGGVSRRGRSALLVAEVSLAVVLLSGAGLLIEGLLSEISDDRGYRTEGILTGDIALSGPNYVERSADDIKHISPKIGLFWENLLDRIRALPGVESAAAMSRLPHRPWGPYPFSIVGRAPADDPRNRPSLHYNEVVPDTFETLDIPLLKGRYLTSQDTAGAPWTLVVNETFAQRYFPDQEALGQTIRMIRRSEVANIDMDEPQVREIVGVVANVRDPSWAQEPTARAYGSSLQHPTQYAGGEHSLHRGKTLTIRTSVAPMSLAEPLRNIVNELDPDQVVTGIKTMEADLTDLFSWSGFLARLLGVFAILAISLALVGIYGVTSYLAGQRRREFGLRMALGAERGSILRLVLRQALTPTLIGLGIGVAGSLALRSTLDGLVGGVTAADPGMFGLIAALIIGAAVLAGVVPAMRAMRVDPMVTLRYE